MLESSEILFETTEYPPHEKFFSKLTNSNVTEEDYLHGKKSWDLYKCQDFSDYTSLYCALGK